MDSFRPADTSPEAWAAQADAYRRMGGRGRTAVMYRLNEEARELALAGIRARHPDYTPDQVRQAWFRLKLGDELTRAAWPDRPLIDP
jgi:hypothetical protein